MGAACSLNGGKGRCIQNGRTILKSIFKNWHGVTVWIDLSDSRDRWRALVNAVMNLRVP